MPRHGLEREQGNDRSLSRESQQQAQERRKGSEDEAAPEKEDRVAHKEHNKLPPERANVPAGDRRREKLPPNRGGQASITYAWGKEGSKRWLLERICGRKRGRNFMVSPKSILSIFVGLFLKICARRGNGGDVGRPEGRQRGRLTAAAAGIGTAAPGEQGDIGIVDGAIRREKGGVRDIDREPKVQGISQAGKSRSVGKGRQSSDAVVGSTATGATTAGTAAPTAASAGARTASARAHSKNPSV